MAGRLSQSFFVALAFLLAVCSSFDAAAASPEAAVLLRFKGTVSDSAGSLETWVAGTAPCHKSSPNWAGVVCDGEGRVFRIRLEKMALSGALSGIGILRGLPALRTLSFMNNNFEGPMPEVGKLPSLRAVFLSMNKFSGEIPEDAFDGMRRLKKIHLSWNNFSGPIPASIARLQKLLDLRLEGNRFSGEIPALQSPGVKLLNVSGNYLEGPIPACMSKIDPSAFADNKDLCGEPLQTACQSPWSSLLSPPRRNAGITSRQQKVPLLFITLAIFILAGVMLVWFRARSARRPKGEELALLPSAVEVGVKKLEEGSDDSNSTGPKSEATSCSVLRRQQHGAKQRIIFVRRGRERFELQEMLSSPAEVLGTGDFGSSSYAVTLPSGQPVVVKRYRKMNGVGREDFEEHMRRLGRLSHPNLLPLVAYCYKKNEKLLVMDYAAKTSLSDALHGSDTAELVELDWPTRLKIVRGITRGLNYLYEELQMLSIPHGQLKSSSIFLDDSLEPLLDEYALAPVLDQESVFQDLAAYRTPEFKQHGKGSKKSDVWCLGILILEILTGKRIPEEEEEAGNLAEWVNSVAEEEIDGEMAKETATGEEEMKVRLVKIAVGCCEESVERRYELEEVLDLIDELKNEV